MWLEALVRGGKSKTLPQMARRKAAEFAEKFKLSDYALGSSHTPATVLFTRACATVEERPFRAA
jgi:hypothetical protein